MYTFFLPQIYTRFNLMAPLLNAEDLLVLRNERDILHLIYHRNKNQHRQAKWWSHLNILKRRLSKLLVLFDGETIPEEEIYKQSRFIVKRLVPDCYTKFYQLIEVGNFITLGFALIGLLSRIYCILIEIADMKAEKAVQELKSEMLGSHVILDGIDDDIGEVISPETAGPSSARHHSKEKERQNDKTTDKSTKVKILKESSEKKKKKKKKSAIDDIFG
ncbi:unnamed protein product [Kuraishia capsulata CBS 1993]|uniref:RNase MRP protein 1 RNA binding domain-containing protein n=1 Tax=Kuraishia capsulata CBS 1993 TaxID=1382522 RepID=W6MHN3_9ASCO|nr:uncharacterized protein KUCA_T00001245001 [Kuraishia capsulata CBS 1993]CDK25278.1 unnamed protein product [Kuraishia capsulata CBS 1993]